MSDNNATLQSLKAIASKFILDRDWRQYHGAKNISMNLAVEAAELMELFTWVKDKHDAGKIVQEKKEAVKHELSDILFSLLIFADEYNIDLAEAFKEKMIHNAEKYPVDTCKGINKKYTEY
jgi:NTP pyrophosphatase (non-canonical NTP hydrolase)